MEIIWFDQGIYPRYIDTKGGVILIEDEDYNFGIADLYSGKILVPTEYKYISDFEDGKALAEKEDKLFYIDKYGNYLGDAGNTWVTYENENLKILRTYGFIGYYRLVKKNVEVIIPVKYAFIRSVGNGYIYAKPDHDSSLVYILDENTGEVVKEMEIDSLGEFKEKGYFIATKDGKHGILDSNLNILVDIKYDSLIYAERSDMLIAKLNGKYGVIDYMGNEVVPFIYDKKNILMEKG